MVFSAEILVTSVNFWLSSGYFCVMSKFLGVLTTGLEIRLPSVETLLPLQVWVM